MTILNLQHILSRHIQYIELIIVQFLFTSLLFFCYHYFYTKYYKKAYKIKISLLESQSLQAQMNPHFVFNILNGIQSLLILKSERKINQYLGRFSTLLRKTLEVNERESVSLKEEVEYLKAYLELQKMRLKDKFNYFFDISIDVEPLKFYLPPMLLQPIVENAIIHGISPLKINGILVIIFKYTSKGLQINIEDNGIGIETSKKKTSLHEKGHNSLGNRILHRRIKLINKNQKEKIIYNSEDLNKSDIASGTRITLDIPFETSDRLALKSYQTKTYEKNFCINCR